MARGDAVVEQISEAVYGTWNAFGLPDVSPTKIVSTLVIYPLQPPDEYENINLTKFVVFT